MGLTTGAVTRVIDRLEQAGYVRRTTDPADRRRVVIEVVPERVATVESLLDSLGTAAAADAERYTDEQLATINDFLSRMADLTQTEATRIRTDTTEHPSDPVGPSEYTAPLGGLASAKLLFRAGAQDLRLRTGKPRADLYRGRFEGAAPQIRVRDGRVIVQYRGIPFDWRKRTGTMAPQPGHPVDDRDRRRHQPHRGRPDRAGPAAPRDHGRVRAHADRARPAARRGPGQVTGGVKTVRLERPKGVPIRLAISGGVGTVEFDGQMTTRHGGGTSIESRGWADAGDRYTLEINGGAKTVTIVERP